MTRHCIRCSSVELVDYSGRLFCLDCGYTFHRESASVEEEEERRKATA